MYALTVFYPYKTMRGFHVHRGIRPSGMEKQLKDGNQLWYTTVDDEFGWIEMEKDIGREDFGGYIVYEIIIPDSCLTFSVHNTDPTKVLVLNKENLAAFRSMFKTEIQGKKRSVLLRKLSERFAGIDVNDTALRRTTTFKLINGEGLPSGVLWRFSGLDIVVKPIEVYKAS